MIVRVIPTTAWRNPGLHPNFVFGLELWSPNGLTQQWYQCTATTHCSLQRVLGSMRRCDHLWGIWILNSAFLRFRLVPKMLQKKILCWKEISLLHLCRINCDFKETLIIFSVFCNFSDSLSLGLAFILMLSGVESVLVTVGVVLAAIHE